MSNTNHRRVGWAGRAVLALTAGLAVHLLIGTYANRQAAPHHRPPAPRYMYSLTIDGSTYGAWYSDQAFPSFGYGDRLIIQRDSSLYLIMDKATIHAVAMVLDPVMRLGKEQGELGRKQGELGRRQGAMGAQQGALGRKIGEFARGMSHAHGARLADLQHEMDALGRKQETLAHQQEALGRDQEALGRNQEALGRKQEAEGRIAPILDAAFAKGLAKRVAPASQQIYSGR